MTDREIINRKIESLTPPLVRQWLSERLANCQRIAVSKTGADREGWLDDAAYFAAAMGLVEWSEIERLEGASPFPPADRQP